MSGPKDYSPPTYSIQAFDGKLNQVFRLQAQLAHICAEIEATYVADKTISVEINGKKELSRNYKQINEAGKSLLFNHKGRFSQDTYNQIDQQIETKLNNIQSCLQYCETLKKKLQEQRFDYDAYKAHLTFHENADNAYSELKKQNLDYLKTNLEAPTLLNEFQKNLEILTLPKPIPFFFGFGAKKEHEKQVLVNQVQQKEEELEILRAQTGQKSIQANRPPVTPAPEELADENKALLQKIETLVRTCDDAAIRKKYTEDIARLKKSQTFKDVYFFKELHDTIWVAEKLRKQKTEIQTLLAEINQQPFHASVNPEKLALKEQIIQALAATSLPANRANGLRDSFIQLHALSKKNQEEEMVRHREKLFLKSQLVLSLENLGYEVMDDLEVIDFETEKDFLLKIKGQENYLSLRFKDDGSMRYAFQIPEKKEALSTDQKKMKLHEMEVTCSEFLGVLAELEQLGLKIPLKSDHPINEAALITLNAGQQEKLKSKPKEQKQQQLRKKYLD